MRSPRRRLRASDMRRPVLAVALALLASLPPAAISLISVNDEIKLGRETQGQVRKQVPQLADRAITDYVTSVGRRLAARAAGPKYPYSFSVANYRELNAFALPGG